MIVVTIVADVEKRNTLQNKNKLLAILCQPFICRLEFSPLLAAIF